MFYTLKVHLSTGNKLKVPHMCLFVCFLKNHTMYVEMFLLNTLIWMNYRTVFCFWVVLKWFLWLKSQCSTLYLSLVYFIILFNLHLDLSKMFLCSKSPLDNFHPSRILRPNVHCREELMLHSDYTERNGAIAPPWD